jgi:hypothetical protein
MCESMLQGIRPDCTALLSSSWCVTVYTMQTCFGSSLGAKPLNIFCADALTDAFSSSGLHPLVTWSMAMASDGMLDLVKKIFQRECHLRRDLHPAKGKHSQACQQQSVPKTPRSQHAMISGPSAPHQTLAQLGAHSDHRQRCLTRLQVMGIQIAMQPACCGYAIAAVCF